MDTYISNLKEKLLNKYKESNDELIYRRYKHSLGTYEMASELTEHLIATKQIKKEDIDIEKLQITALIHDYAKFVSKREYEEIILQNNLSFDILDEEQLLHSILGVYVIEEELDIHDREILNAIKHHTTGKKDMTLLEELIYLIDFIERTREDRIANKIRDVAFKNYKKAIAMALESTINYLRFNNRHINSLSLEAYQQYKKYLKEKDDKLLAVIETIEGNLVKDLKVYNIQSKTPYYDYLIVATAPSERQMQAAVSYLKGDFDTKGVEIGKDWSLIDLYDIIVNVFTEDARVNYGLDKLYATYEEKSE